MGTVDIASCSHVVQYSAIPLWNDEMHTLLTDANIIISIMISILTCIDTLVTILPGHWAQGMMGAEQYSSDCALNL